MNDPVRMKELNEAWKLIETASHEEKEELFSWLINALKEHHARFDAPDNRFDSHEDHAYRAMDTLRLFLCRLLGYNMGWVPEKFIEHCAYNSGRPPKYSRETRTVKCYFIFQMLKRGASKTQAMKLLMRLRGDRVMTSGLLRELQDTYRDYERIGGDWEHDLPLAECSAYIVDFLDFDVSNLDGDEKASLKAVEAFRMFMQELIDLMKSNHELVASRDRSYPEIFGPIVDWISKEYNDPLDYFYKHQSTDRKQRYKIRRGFIEYLNAIWVFNEGLQSKSQEESYFHS